MSDYSRDSVTITLPGWDDHYDDSIHISSGSSDTITLSGLSDANLTIGGGSNAYPWTTTATPWVTGTGIGIGTDWNTRVTPKIKLDGEGADIEVNGESLMGMLRAIEDRLNILKPNESLESEWEELRALGEQYRALEKHILEKQATWDRLRAMPPPEID